MDHKGTVMRILAAGGMLVLMSGLAVAQPPIFRHSQTSTSGLPGSIDSTFYVDVVLFADIGAPSGAGTPDGIPDLITANSDQKAAILFGNGDGTFTTEPNINLKTIPTSILLADFDGDKVLDLIVSDTSSVEFLHGNNDGSFRAPGPPVAAGRGPSALAAMELNHDNKLDLIVVDDGDQFGSGAVTILMGNGNGTFGPGPAISTGAGSAAVALGKFGSDSETDLAVANEGSDDVTILRGAGNGGFTKVQTIPVGLGPVAIAALDLNGDHQLDLVVVNSNSDTITVLDGTSSGTFKAARTFPSGSSGSSPNGLALADLNLDGHIDVITPNNRSNDASVLLGDGKGNFGAPRSFVADSEPVAVAATDITGKVLDLNHDTMPDVVTVNRGSQVPSAAVLLGQGDGSLVGVEDVATLPNPSGVIAGDTDNDGVSDLIVAHGGSTSGSLSIYPAESLGFGPPTILPSVGDTTAIASGDFNGDGFLDLVAVNQNPAKVSLFLGRPGGKFAAAQNFPIGPQALAVTVGDWNRDGRPDLAIIRQGDGVNGAVDIVLTKSDGTFSAPVPFTVGMNPTVIDSGDFDKDGKRDLVVGNTDGLALFLGKGDGTFKAGNTLPISLGLRALTVADFDRDGADDVAVARSSMSANVLVIYGDGNGGFLPGMQSASVRGVPSALAARDLTGDLIPDLIVTDQVSNAVSVFVSSSSRTLTFNDSVIVSRGPISAAAADFDGDGRYDAAAANGFVAGSVSVLTNIFAPAVVRGDGNGDGKVTAADAVAVMRELGDGNGSRVEQVQVAGGAYPAAPGIDANGDGLVTAQDALAVAHRLFPRL